MDTLSWLFGKEKLPAEVRVALAGLALKSFWRAVRDVVWKVLEYAGPLDETEWDEPWKVVVKAFAGAIGLDRAEAIAFVDRGETEEGKQARLKALFAAHDLGGLHGCIGLVFSDLSEA